MRRRHVNMLALHCCGPCTGGDVNGGGHRSNVAAGPASTPSWFHCQMTVLTLRFCVLLDGGELQSYGSRAHTISFG